MQRVSKSLGGRVALVTGAGRGAGRAIALAEAGARVALIDVNPDALQGTANEIAGAGGQAWAHAADVGNKMAVQTAIYQVLEKWGRVDILVNAARVAPSRPALTLGEWEWSQDHLEMEPDAGRESQGRVSGGADGGQGDERGRRWYHSQVVRPVETGAHAAVHAGRAGLVGLTEALAAEWAPLGIKVEVVEELHPEQAAANVLWRCDVGYRSQC